MQGTIPFALMPFKKAVDKAHLLCQTLRMENLEYLDKSYEFVTLADFGTQVIINKALCSISPKQRIISEETSEEFLKVTTPEQRAQIVTKVSQVLNDHLTQEEFISWLDYGQDNKDIGWYVGYLETNNKVYYFANCIQSSDINNKDFANARIDIVYLILDDLKLIDK